jgi:hypothetical protein
MGITDKKQVERHLGRSVGTSVGFSKNRKFAKSGPEIDSA